MKGTSVTKIVGSTAGIARKLLPAMVIILAFASLAFAQNSISGIVFDPQNHPVSDIEIELLDSFERLVGSRKTTGSGFYTFQRLGPGIYYLKVRVAGTAFREAKKRIDLGDLNALGGVDQKQVDVNLRYDSRVRPSTPALTGVVFAQEVPESAKDHYESARKLADKGKMAKAVDEATIAVDEFPDFFKALELLGNLHLKTEHYAEAEAAFSRAVRVNGRCFGCFFNLAVAQNKLGRKEEAAHSLVSANEIDAGSINAHLLLGIVFRDLKRYEDAESALLKAKQLGRDDQPDVNWQLAELYYFDLKEPEKAVSELKSFLSNLSSSEKRKNSGKVAGIRKLINKIESEIERPS